MKPAHAIHEDNSLEGSDGDKHMDATISGHNAEAFKENVCITQTGRAAAVLIVVPTFMEGSLRLLPDLLRRVRLETQLLFLTGHLRSQGGRREAGEHCTLLICWFWFKCFYNSLKAPLLQVSKQLF